MPEEKGIIRNPSKKMFVGLFGLIANGGALLAAIELDAEPMVQTVLAAGFVAITPSLLFGLAWMDALVRGMKAWRGGQ